MVAAGFDTIEHCSWATEDGIVPDDAVIAEIVAKGIAVSLTVGVVPGGPPPENIRSRIAAFVSALHTMRDAGVTLVCGSDNADLVAVVGDPLSDIAAVRNVMAVFRSGRRIPHI